MSYHYFRGLSRFQASIVILAESLRSCDPTTILWWVMSAVVLYKAMPDSISATAERMVQVPEMAESISEGTLKQFSKSVGDYVEQDEEIATIETDKIDVAVNAPEAGTIKEFLAKEEDTVTVGQEIVKLDAGAAAPEGHIGSKKDDSKPEQREEAAPKQGKPPPPQEKRREEAPTEAKPTTPKQDQKPSPPPSPPPKQQEKKPKDEPKSSEQKTPNGKPGGREERRVRTQALEVKELMLTSHQVKMNRMRLRIAERLKQSQNTAASLTTFQKVDMHSLLEFRKLYRDEVLKNTGVKLGFMSAFTRASILAMKDIPAVNASIQGPEGGDTIVYREYVDVSVAVATEKGLVTPVVRNAESKDLVGIESSIAELGKKVLTL